MLDISASVQNTHARNWRCAGAEYLWRSGGGCGVSRSTARVAKLTPGVVAGEIIQTRRSNVKPPRRAVLGKKYFAGAGVSKIIGAATPFIRPRISACKRPVFHAFLRDLTIWLPGNRHYEATLSSIPSGSVNVGVSYGYCRASTRWGKPLRH